ncbi:hypothetical protein APY03_3381 [Variovorax sp. WDL1]|nr:hypothetical protein APY03_3381 [Variovorax sp. WDL1]
MDEALVDGLADSSDYGFWSTEAANAAANAAGALQDIEQAITEFREDPEIALPPFSLK